MIYVFGRRPDGRRIEQEDPILALVPYIMPTRVDAQVHSVQRVDFDVLTRYIRAQRDKEQTITYLDLIVAAYVRTISQYPELNRFILNKQNFARNTICVSLAILRKFENSEKIEETTLKFHFSPYDTIYDVHNKLDAEISANRQPEARNGTDKIARVLLAVPGLPLTIVSLARLLDRYGLLPRAIINVSPFHTGLFVTNMLSLGMPYVNHHIYNFGTTSLFISMGKVERNPSPAPDGSIAYHRMMPLGVVSDERITSGAVYGMAFGCWRDHLAEPARLETPPETVRFDLPPEKMPPVLGRWARAKARRAAEG